MSTRQRVAVVTGGGGGIGGAIAEDLGRSGWFVVTVDPLVTLDGTEQLARTRGDHGRAHRGRRRLGPGLLGLGHRRRRPCVLSSTNWPTSAAASTPWSTWPASPGRATRPRDRGGLAGPARRAPGRLPQRARGSAAAHGGGRARAHPRHHLGFGLAGGRRRRLQRGQARRRLPDLAAGPAGAPRRHRQRPLTHRQHPHGAGRPRAGPARGPQGRRGRTDAQLHARARGHRAAGRPRRQRRLRLVQRPGALRRRSRGGGRRPAPPHRGRAHRRTPPRWPACSTRSSPAPSSPPRPSRPATAAATRASPASSTRPRRPSTPPVAVQSCAIVSDRPELAGALQHRPATTRAIACHQADVAHGFDGTAKSCSRPSKGPDRSTPSWSRSRATRVPRARSTGWEHVLADHRGLLNALHDDASWSRAVADYTAAADRPVRLHDPDRRHHTGRPQPGPGRRRSWPASPPRGTKGRVTAFTAGLEADRRGRHRGRGRAGGPAARPIPTAPPWPGPSWWCSDHWIGLRSHPRPIGTVTYGGPAIPDWLDDSLREIVGRHRPTGLSKYQ